MVNIGCSWSGGKDSCFALMQEMAKGKRLKLLINMMNEDGRISRSHGLPLQILHDQATAMNTELVATPSTWQQYKENFVNTLSAAKEKHAIEEMVFGDIDLQPHRDWEEMVCNETGLKAQLPLWQQDRKELVIRMIRGGIKSVIVSCNKILGAEFLGKSITEELLPELEKRGVDVCGENGEFHTVVVDSPLFSRPIALPSYTKVKHESYWFLNWSKS